MSSGIIPRLTFMLKEIRMCRILYSFIPFVMIAFSAAAVRAAEEQNPPGRVIGSHQGSVLWVSYTNDGKTLVSSSRDKTIKIWDVASGELKRTLTNHTADVYCVTFSHDSKLMASGSVDKRIILWDAK